MACQIGDITIRDVPRLGQLLVLHFTYTIIGTFIAVIIGPILLLTNFAWIKWSVPRNK
jgi:hypothetical protein